MIIGVSRTSLRLVAAVIAVASIGACAFGRQLRGPASVEPASTRAIEFTLLLVGDAGYARAADPVLAAMTAAASAAPERTAMVFLGDNLYPVGLAAEGEEDRARGERILSAQVAAARSAGVRGLFVPGNHDWDSGHQRGWEKVRYQGRYIRSRGGEMYPAEGCPGPSVVDFSASVRLVALDTQWWLHKGPKPLHPDSDCPTDSEEEVLDALTTVLAESGDHHVIVVGHHPLASTGKHGGYFDWKLHVFPMREIAPWLWIPLPVIGSAYPAVRSLFPTRQNLASSVNRHMRHAVDSVLALHPPLAYASGHEHNLQVMEGDAAQYLLISGAGPSERPYAVGRAPRTLYALAESGYMRIDFLRNGRARLGVVAIDRDRNDVEVYSRWLDERKEAPR